MSAMASQITSLTIAYSTVCSGTDERKHQSPASLAFVRGIHRSSVNYPHKGPVTREMFPFDDVIMFIAVPKFVGATAKANGRPTASGFDVFKGTFDGELQTCSEINLPFHNDRRKHYELKFAVPLISYYPGVLSWALIVKFLTDSRGTGMCHYPGMTVYVDDVRNANVYKECPRLEAPVHCEFRCSGYKGLENPLGNQPDVLRLFFVRLEVPMYGDWPMPVDVCEIKTRWEPEIMSTGTRFWIGFFIGSYSNRCEICLTVNTLRPRQNGRHFADELFKCIFLKKKSIKILLKFGSKYPIDNIPALVQIMALRRPATSHYLNKWWLDYRRIYASLGLNELICTPKYT